MINATDVMRAEKEEWRGPPFILTYTGREFHYGNFGTRDISIRDIAHALAHLCRYMGHTNMFYSVAQHSLLVSEKILGGPEDKLVALLHDAAEAYTNDLASPLKEYLRQFEDCYCPYTALQNKIAAVIYERYGIKRIPDNMRLYDQAAGVFEAEGFMGLSVEDLEKYGFPTGLRELWQPWDPKEFAGTSVDREFGDVEVEFISRFEVLMHDVCRERLI